MPLPIELPLSAADAYQRVTEMARSTLSSAEAMRSNILRGDVRPEQLCDLFDFLRLKGDDGAKLATVTGLEAYAKSIHGAGYSITQSFGAVLVAGAAITDWVIATLPGDGNGGIITRRFVTGGITEKVVIPADVIAQLIPLLDALIASIKG